LEDLNISIDYYMGETSSNRYGKRYEWWNFCWLRNGSSWFYCKNF